MARKTKPDMVLTHPNEDGVTFEIWMLNPGEHCKLGASRDMHFPHNTGDKTASLVYVRIDKVWGTHATEHDIDDPKIWGWIQKFMHAGLEANTYRVK